MCGRKRRSSRELSAALQVPPAQVGERVTALLEEIKTLKKQASQRPREAGAGVSADDLLAAAQEIGGSRGHRPGRREPSRPTRCAS